MSIKSWVLRVWSRLIWLDLHICLFCILKMELAWQCSAASCQKTYQLWPKTLHIQVIGLIIKSGQYSLSCCLVDFVDASQHAVPIAGANGNIRTVIFSAPALFLFCLLQIGIHLGLSLGAGKLLGFRRRDILVASNANVGGEFLCTDYNFVLQNPSLSAVSELCPPNGAMFMAWKLLRPSDIWYPSGLQHWWEWAVKAKACHWLMDWR